MWSGYFTVGGNEVGNSARALGYTKTADCPITWLRDVECGGLTDALGGGGYVYSSIDQAPWFDPDNVDLTSRFLGLYVVSMEGVSDSTRSANITEKIVDGAQVSGYRHQSREVRIRAMLSAKGGDALEAGMTWLRNVLEPDACGVHGADCGASDFQFFVDCPPTRALLPVYSAYTETRRNLFSNPRGTSTSATYWSTAANGAYSLVTDMPVVATGLRWTASATAGGRIAMVSGTSTPTAGAPIHFMATIRSSIATTLTIQARPTVTSATGAVQLGAVVNLVPGTNNINVTAPSFTAATTSASGIVLLPGTVLVGSTIDVTSALIEVNSGAYFDGATPDTNLYDYAWVGTEDLSQSTLGARDITGYVPEADDVYQDRLDDYWRVLHTVTCVSGPLIQQAMKSNDKTHVGYLVEFTMLAAVPFVFSRPHEIEVPPITPTVIEDTAFNLEPYPSAELTNSTLTVATNYSTNPSLEVNTTDWTTSTEIVSGTDPAAFFTAGRVVGELSASGTASLRVRILGNDGGTVVTNARSYMWATQSVPFSTGTGTRVSFNVWAACVEFAGASGGVINGIQVDAQWRATTTVLSTVTIGSSTDPADFGGKAFSIASQLKPPTANNALVRVRFDVTWSSSATPANDSEIRGYVDALAVTVP